MGLSIFYKTSKLFQWNVIVWWLCNFAIVVSMVSWFGGSYDFGGFKVAWVLRFKVLGVCACERQADLSKILVRLCWPWMHFLQQVYLYIS